MALGSPTPPWPATQPAVDDAGPPAVDDAGPPAAGYAGSPDAPWTSAAEPNPAAVLDFSKPGGPAVEKQKMLHFISHIDAECFISLLQTMDPPPDDPRARAEYRRFYRQLREVLEVPVLPLYTPQVGAATAPLK